MNNLAIIPARAGSKRIPNKNIKDFNGMPVISYAIRNAIESGLFKDVLVSTDSDIIKNLARDFGASAISKRPQHLSDDFTTTSSVMQYEVKKYIESKTSVEFICCLYPVTPLLTINRIQEGFEKIKEGIWDYVFSGQTVKSNPERYFKLGDNKTIEVPNLEFMNKRTQDLPKYFQDAGQFYWGTPKAWLNLTPIFSKKSSIVLLGTNEVVDIDTFDDWRYAELLSKIGDK